MKILFMGQKKYAAEMLEWTVQQNQQVVAVVTDDHLPNSYTTQIAQRLQIPLLSMEQAEDAFTQDPDFADLVVSYLFWLKIKEPLISAPRIGCINFHPAILPDYKGRGGYNIAIMNKLKQWGASSHFVDKSIDTGEIIRVFRFDFDYRFETAQSLEQKTQSIQQDLYKSVLKDIIEGKDLSQYTVSNIGGHYTSKKEMLAMMEIDPEKDNVELKCHAFWYPPYSGATIKIQGKNYTLVDDLILSQMSGNDE